MSPKPERYPALYVIFTLLNAIRHGIQRKNIWREFRRQKIALRPRLAFWLALSKEAGLVDYYQRSGPVDENQLRVTRYARQWLDKTPEEQTFHLIESWQNAPKNRKARLFRKKLLWKLKYDQPLTQKDLQAINGLEAIGLVSPQNQLTRWGKFFIQPRTHYQKSFEACGVKGEGELPTPRPPAPCQIQEERFIASLPQHIGLLWELEKHLRPASPGIYPLTKRALRFLQGDPQDLIALLERGLWGPLPEEIKARLLDQPSLRVIEGIVLEFSHAMELARLRRQPNFRRHFEEVLSPRHVLIPTKDSKSLFQMLKRRGVYVSYHEESSERKKKRTHNVVNTLLHPQGRSLPKRALLEKYLQLQQAIDVLYHAPGYPAEKRRITPLVIEQRGEHTYVTAFCQTRRAQRLFRLDRMEIPGTY
jgi:hypothetical protein